jgi:hypothetical protein
MKELRLDEIALTFRDADWRQHIVKMERKDERWICKIDHNFIDEFLMDEEAMEEALGRLTQIRDMTRRVREIMNS